MKKLYIVAFTLFISLSIQSQEVFPELLNRYYLNSFGEDSVKFRKLFFENFPSNYNDFQHVYGYENGKKGELYDVGFKHIHELFNQLECINDTVYYKKLVDISLNGSWDADAVSYFQRGVWSRVFKNPQLATHILSLYSEEEIKSFFLFFFDGIHPMWKEIPRELIVIKDIDENIYAYLGKALKEVNDRKGGNSH
jgi:hypothetical protein